MQQLVINKTSQRLADSILEEVREQITTTCNSNSKKKFDESTNTTMTDPNSQNITLDEKKEEADTVKTPIDQDQQATQSIDIIEAQLSESSSPSPSDEYSTEKLAQSLAEEIRPEIVAVSDDQSCDQQQQERQKDEERKNEDNHSVGTTDIELDNGVVLKQGGQIDELSAIDMMKKKTTTTKKQTDNNDDNCQNEQLNDACCPPNATTLTCNDYLTNANSSDVNNKVVVMNSINSETSISISEQQQQLSLSSIPSETTTGREPTETSIMATSNDDGLDDDNYAAAAAANNEKESLQSQQQQQEPPIEVSGKQQEMPPSNHSSDTDKQATARQGVINKQQPKDMSIITTANDDNKETTTTTTIIQSNNNNHLASGDAPQDIGRHSSELQPTMAREQQELVESKQEDDKGDKVVAPSKESDHSDNINNHDHGVTTMMMPIASDDEPEYFLEKDAASGAVLQRLKAEAIEDLSVCNEQKMALKAARELFAQFDARGQAPVLVKTNKSTSPVDASSTTTAFDTLRGPRSTSSDSDSGKSCQDDLLEPRRSPTSVSRSTLVYSNVQSVSPDGSCSGKGKRKRQGVICI